MNFSAMSRTERHQNYIKEYPGDTKAVSKKVKGLLECSRIIFPLFSPTIPSEMMYRGELIRYDTTITAQRQSDGRTYHFAPEA